MNIIYSDRDLAVILKPVGMDSEHQVPAAIIEKLGGEVFPIHRLDLNVGGVMVYARTKQAAAALSKAVQEGTMVKEYVALPQMQQAIRALKPTGQSRNKQIVSTLVRMKQFWLLSLLYAIIAHLVINITVRAVAEKNNI